MFLAYDLSIFSVVILLLLLSDILFISTSHVCLNNDLATINLLSLLCICNVLGHPPLHIKYFKSLNVRSDLNDLLFTLLSNKSFKETLPLESLLSYKLIGYIFILDILKVPV